MCPSLTKIVGIYLAAGQSTRMGQDKLLLPFEGGSLGQKALCETAKTRLEAVFVISRKQRLDEWRLASTPFFKEIDCGEDCSVQSDSIKKGIQLARDHGYQAAMILLADQPFVTRELMDTLINEFERGDYDYVAASYNNEPRPPIILSEKLFSEVMRLKGDKGARLLLRDKSKRGCILRINDEKPFIDIDTWEDYTYFHNRVSFN